jgi:hypothetical protein
MKLEDLDKIVLGETKLRRKTWEKYTFLIVEWLRSSPKKLVYFAGTSMCGDVFVYNSEALENWEFYQEPEELLEEWEYIEPVSGTLFKQIGDPGDDEIAWKQKTGRKFRKLDDGRLELVE